MDIAKALLVRVAVAAALTGTSTGAPALTPDEVPPENRVLISGATMTDLLLREVFIHSNTVLPEPGLCQAGTIDVYEGSNQLAVLCRARSDLGAQFADIEGEPIAYIKESNGTWVDGTEPVANQTSLTFMDLGTTSIGGGCTGVIPNTQLSPGQHFVRRRTGCNATSQAVPGAGIADAEARLMLAPLEVQQALTPFALIDVVFGVPVSTPLFRALQGAQGLTQNDDCANVPTLTRQQVAGLYVGFIGSAGQFVAADEGDDGAVLPDEQIYVCRRGDLSAAQGGAEAHFLRQRCMDGVATFVGPDESILCLDNGCTWPGGSAGVPDFRDDFVYAGSGPSQVRSCLDFHGDQGHFAIGVLSTESNPFSGTGQSFRWVRVDGALSTLDQTANGNWDFFVSTALNIHKPGVLNVVQKQLVDYIVAKLGIFLTNFSQAPLPPGNVCATGNGMRGDGGALAVAGTPFPVAVEAPFSAGEILAARINTRTKQPLGVLNNCQSPLPVTETAAGGQFRENVPEF